MKEKIVLRPVEAYFLLSFAKKEEWNMTNALIAVLVELYEQNLIIPDGADPNALKVNYVDINSDYLRSYESTALEAVASHDLEFLHDAIDDFRFKNFLLKNGLLTKERKYFLFLHYQQTVLSSAGLELVTELLTKKQALVQEKSPVLSAVMAFPSLNYTNALIAYFRAYAIKAVTAANKRYADFIPELNPLQAHLSQQQSSFL